MLKRKPKICIQCGKSRLIWSKGRCKACALIYSSPKKTKKKKTDFQKERDKTDYVFSILVRLLGADSEGMVKCYTCDYKGFWKKDGIEAGHFKSRGHMSTRYDLDNCKPQCNYCNQTLSGNLKVYQQKLYEEFGERFLGELIVRSAKAKSFNVEDLRRLRKTFNTLIRKIKKQKNL